MWCGDGGEIEADRASVLQMDVDGICQFRYFFELRNKGFGDVVKREHGAVRLFVHFHVCDADERQPFRAAGLDDGVEQAVVAVGWIPSPRLENGVCGFIPFADGGRRQCVFIPVG